MSNTFRDDSNFKNITIRNHSFSLHYIIIQNGKFIKKNLITLLS